MAPTQPEHPNRQTALAPVDERIVEILAGIRVSDLPYPVGRIAAEQVTDWRPLLQSCWKEQRDESVIHVVRSVSQTWTVRQVNAAYIADRIMDVFLRTSGLHPVLVQRIARLRFFLAWRMASETSTVIDPSLLSWLDSLMDWRGWSDSGGRSSRSLLEQLDELVTRVTECFEQDSVEPFNQFAAQWQQEADQRHQRSDRLHVRLLETERGAARQRRAEQTARASVGRALSGRELPKEITEFVLDYWLPLLREIVWDSGLEGDNWRHAVRLLEWLVWIGDPSLSDKDRDRLYQVGEQLGDRITDVWGRVKSNKLPAQALEGVESVMMTRLRGDDVERFAAISPDRPFTFDGRWLSPSRADVAEVNNAVGNWYVEGEGSHEQRRFFLALLDESQEVLWTNGFGVKLALTSWKEFQQQTEERLRPLPPLNKFGGVLSDTVSALAKVLEAQRRQREKAAMAAKEKADALRKQIVEADLKRQQEDDLKAAELARQQGEAEAVRLADEAAIARQKEQARVNAATQQVDGIKPGGWIVLDAESNTDEGGASASVRLKLAVRINASRKLIFVDRLGLNRREYSFDQLVHQVAGGEVRVLSSAAEFDDTLSRVVGRIRVGRTQR
ncbi:DUF1631 family protein [Marinobacter caseinilyticus]|uniref:DUF1631 family protein n=1 Tax=Marinobacter caseinilyticus TaxID=2692195 RepID=UPI0014089E09|nr:DUF1631 family protein [Marinobacter caseinilyticus]